MTGFEPRISDIGSGSSTYNATSTAFLLYALPTFRSTYAELVGVFIYVTYQRVELLWPHSGTTRRTKSHW